MKLNIISGLLFALLLTAGINIKATAQCCHWHSYSCCEHMDSKDKENDKDKDKKEEADDKSKDNDKECCHHSHCCGYHYWGCHSWCYVAPRHCGTCCHHHYSCYHSCYHHHCDDCCGHGYYYRGGGH